jgi:hypothetical protein
MFKSLNLPVSSSYTRPCTHRFFLSAAHADFTGSELTTFSTCARTLASAIFVSASGSGTSLRSSVPASAVSGASQRASGVVGGGGGVLAVTALRHAAAPPQFV